MNEKTISINLWPYYIVIVLIIILLIYTLIKGI